MGGICDLVVSGVGGGLSTIPAAFVHSSPPPTWKSHWDRRPPLGSPISHPSNSPSLKSSQHLFCLFFPPAWDFPLGGGIQAGTSGWGAAARPVAAPHQEVPSTEPPPKGKSHAGQKTAEISCTGGCIMLPIVSLLFLYICLPAGRMHLQLRI